MKQLVEWIKESACMVVFTGAGMSSGLPNFRSQTGLWRGQDPMRLANPRRADWYGAVTSS
ncbi:hypothetical protein [uncultured Brevibacillus sp.]|uniref:hypothetical protein n=1 Tax=uncultured Brevibacillus sp. TaxID=169970 RepID=UPI00339065FC